MKKMIMSILLTLVMVIGLLPTSALVAEPSPPTNLRWDGYVAKWDAVDGASSYSVELCRDDKSITGGTSLTPDWDYSSFMVPGQTYKFKVVVRISGSESSPAVSAPLTVPGTIGTITGITWDEYKLSWTPVTGAKYYNVTLYKDGSQVHSDWQLTAAEYDFTSKITAKGAGEYYVKVEADHKVYGNTMATGTSETITVTPPEYTAYTIVFDANGGTEVDPVFAKTDADGKLAELPTPTREGYAFDGWFTAAEGGTEVTLDKVYTANAKIYAQWTEENVPAKTPVTSISVTGVETPSVGMKNWEARENIVLVSTPANALNGYPEDNFKVCDTNSSNWADWTPMSMGETFEAGKYYAFVCTVYPEEGYSFSESVTGQVNGNISDSRFGSVYQDADTARVYYVWGPLVAEPEVTKYDVWVAGTQVTSANAADVFGDGAASYDAGTNTLTVSKDIVTTDIWGAIEAKTTEDFTVIIADGVTLSAEKETCIDVENNLIINCVDLDVTSGSHGIFSKNGSVGFTGKEISVVSDGIGIYGNNIKIKCDKLAVDAKGTMAMLASSGICSENDIEIECNTLSVASGDEESIYAKNGDVSISGSEDSEIVLVAGDGNGVRSFGDTTIKGGKLGITARRGIYGYGSVNLTVEDISIGAEIYGIGATNGTTGSNNITIKSDKLSVVSADGDAIISDEGDVIITGSDNCEITITADDYGICAEKGSIELTAKDVFVKSKNDYAIDCYEDITIDCDMAKIIGRVTGIRTNGSIIIQNGNFDIQSTDTSESELNYPALRFKTDFTYPAGATVTAATEVDGTFEAYDETKNATYDHVKIGTVSEVTPITTVEIDGVSEPQLNQTREAFWNKYNTELTDGTITLNEKTYVDGKFDNIIVVDGEFYHADKETVVDDSHVIAPGTYYNALALLPAEGFEFAEDITATVDGATATETEFLENGVLVIYAKYVLEAPAPVQPTEYTITIEGGKVSVGAGTPVDKATAGTVITLTVDESAIPAGKVFDKWEVVSGGVTVADGKFTMPANAVEIRATYKDAPVIPTVIDEIKIEGLPAPQYDQTVEQYWNAYLQNESNGELTINGEKLSEDYFGNLYFAGNDLFDGNMDPYDDTDATFTPGTYYFYLCLRPANGYTFADSLNVSVKDVESANVDVDFNDKNDLTKPVYIYVEYEVTAPAVQPTEIDEIKIEGLPAPQYGQTYSQWNDTFNNNCDTGVLKINGSIGVDGWNFGNVFLDGKSLMDETMTHFYETITAGTYYVKLWLYHSEGFVFADGLSITVDGVNPANVTFEQDPDEEECKIVYVKYEITAPSSAPTEYGITVNGGTASVGAGTAVTKSTAGTVITLTVDESAIPAGKVFDKWEVVSGGVAVADGKFTMPECAVEINATYKDAPVDPPFVDWIEINDVTAPVAGTDASIAPNYVVDSARNYTVEKAEWWMNDIDSKATEFVAGTNYRAVFTVVPKEGVVFDSPLKVKIDGKDATVISSSEDKAVVSISLTATSAPVSHTCDIKPVAKDEPSCTEGGKEAYYKCEGCGKFYEDALGAKEITDLANWGNLPKLGHTESDWKSDKDNHWKECTVTACGVIIEDSKAAHKDDNKDGKCDVCEYNVGLPTTPDDDKPNDTPQTGDNSMIWLLIALLFVSGAGVVATTVYGKKKFSVK